jgi:carboxypeptidase T
MKIQFLLILAASFFQLSSSFAQSNASGSNRTYAGVLTELNAIVAANPANAKLITIGDSDSGQKIIGLQAGNGPIHNLVVGTHHGNEYGATETTLAFAKAVAANPIVNQTVFVIPVLNIGGYNTKTRTEMDGHHKVFDPNRNYPSPCGTEGPFTLKDTAALDQFISANNIIASATLHTFSPAVTYPWGYATSDLTTGYESIFKGLVAAATIESHYATGNTTQLIYPANGAFEDYAFEQYGIWSLLFEIGDTHTPNAAQTAELIKVNVPGLRAMLEAAPTTRAANHTFTGKCDHSARARKLDRHDE